MPTAKFHHSITYMHKLLSKRVTTLVLLTLFVSLLAGCSSMQALSSTPPVKAIVLEHSTQFNLGLGKVSLPAGEYKAQMENKGGYFYQAPGKVIYRDISAQITDGGLYIKRGEKTPSRYYQIDPLNSFDPVIMRDLPRNFEAKIVE